MVVMQNLKMVKVQYLFLLLRVLVRQTSARRPKYIRFLGLVNLLSQK